MRELRVDVVKIGFNGKKEIEVSKDDTDMTDLSKITSSLRGISSLYESKAVENFAMIVKNTAGKDKIDEIAKNKTIEKVTLVERNGTSTEYYVEWVGERKEENKGIEYIQNKKGDLLIMINYPERWKKMFTDVLEILEDYN